MGKRSRKQSLVALDNFIFSDIHNHEVWDEDRFDITYEGDNYVVWHKDKNQLHHFRVVIEDYEWDSEQARKDQGWDI